jgi:hypothetical protein
MSCSLKNSKLMLQEFGVISNFNEIIDEAGLQSFEENLMESIAEDVFDNAMGNPFFIERFSDKSKLVFNRSFFNILDNVNNARVFKSRLINEYKEEEIETDSPVSKENIQELKSIYDKIDSMLESNEITVTCKI